MRLSTKAETRVFVAERMLPDNLALVEYSNLVAAVKKVVDSAEALRGFEDLPGITRARYGSDFALAITVAAEIAGVLTALTVSVLNLAKSRLTVAKSREHEADAWVLEQTAAERIEAVRRSLADKDQQRDAVQEVAKQLESLARTDPEAFSEAALNPVPSEEGMKEALALIKAIQLLAKYDIKLDVRDDL